MEILPMVGNPTSLRDLEEAGIKKADLFVSVTPEETTNVTACMLAHNLGAHHATAAFVTTTVSYFNTSNTLSSFV